jgi:hypothetical protein
MDANSRKNELFRVGLVVFFLLAVLTIGEFMLGVVSVSWAAPLFGIAILKAALIIRDYMHLSRLFAGDDEGH